ncbi:A nuclease family of the HNH/ENDO VII superfamily with conserved AHH [Flavimobilis soli]|uniref:A nuclease family of the HNH/ENDO VII superfamily with conserved AHH n=1 Tax=Flavimobilis soli TaxID=442709 RepID=A0A2A9EB78_9MICO|nr:hypothetical protein [Flavimobilis soli]PFG36063.1 A nuclease family of the HNH/ENDO VII superfamily with conserved AHH [Flavimobilis soli]
MNVKKRMKTAVLLAASVIGVQFVALPSAQSLYCPPQSSLCSPAGLALAAEGGIAGLGTATTGAGAATGAALAATTGTAAGVSGITFGNVAANGLAAAAVGVAGWHASSVFLNEGGATGLTTAPPNPGWQIQPEFSFAGWQWVNMGQYRSGKLRLHLDSVPEYGQLKSEADEIRVTYQLEGSCEITGSNNYTAFPGVELRSIWTYGNAVYHSSIMNPANWKGACRDSALTWTVPANLGPQARFSHIVGRMGGHAVSAKVKGSFAPHLSDTEFVPIWYPEGHPGRQAQVNGEGVLARTLICVGNDGLSHEVTDSVAINIAQAGEVPLLALDCPPGSVVESYGAKWFPGGLGSTPETVVPVTETPQWVRDIPTNYPECLTADCWLQLYKWEDGEYRSCGSGGEACPDWYTQADRASSYQCRWGGYVVELHRCAVFRDPGRLLPNAEIDGQGRMVDLIWPPLELDSRAVGRQVVRLIDRHADDACGALGESVRRREPAASVADVALVCHELGVLTSLDFLSRTSGLGSAIGALVSAVGLDEEISLQPDCNEVDLNGACLDGTAPSSPPEPEPAGAGAGVRPPPNCLDPHARSLLEDSMKYQDHHMATHYGTWGAEFQRIADEFGLSVLDAAQAWNVYRIKHAGPHPWNYHDWVWQNMRVASKLASEEVSPESRRARFTLEFERLVVHVVHEDPTIVRAAYWKCRDYYKWR